MYEQLIQTSDLIIKTLDSVESYPIDAFTPVLEKKGITDLIFQKALRLLEYENMIEISGNRGARLTGKGISHAIKGTSIRYYLNETAKMKNLERRVKVLQMVQAVATASALALSIYNVFFR